MIPLNIQHKFGGGIVFLWPMADGGSVRESYL